MSASNAIAGFGTKLQRYNGASYVTIAGIMDISGPSFKLDVVESTHMESTNAWKEFKPTLKSGNDVNLRIQYVPTEATHSTSAGLLLDLKNKTLQSFKIVFSDTTEVSFTAFVVSFEPGAKVDDLLTASVGLHISGEPTGY